MAYEMKKKFFKQVYVPLLRMEGFKRGKHLHIALHSFGQEYENTRWKAIYMAADCIAFCGIDQFGQFKDYYEHNLKRVAQDMKEIMSDYKEDEKYKDRKLKIRGRGIVWLDIYMEDDGYRTPSNKYEGSWNCPHFKWATIDMSKDEKFSHRHMRTKMMEKAFMLSHFRRPLSIQDRINIEEYGRTVDRD